MIGVENNISYDHNCEDDCDRDDNDCEIMIVAAVNIPVAWLMA